LAQPNDSSAKDYDFVRTVGRTWCRCDLGNDVFWNPGYSPCYSPGGHHGASSAPARPRPSTMRTIVAAAVRRHSSIQEAVRRRPSHSLRRAGRTHARRRERGSSIPVAGRIRALSLSARVSCIRGRSLAVPAGRSSFIAAARSSACAVHRLSIRPAGAIGTGRSVRSYRRSSWRAIIGTPIGTCLVCCPLLP
jgi:hypothetical protein